MIALKQIVRFSDPVDIAQDRPHNVVQGKCVHYATQFVAASTLSKTTKLGSSSRTAISRVMNMTNVVQSPLSAAHKILKFKLSVASSN